MQSIAFVTGYNGNRPAGLERFLIELLKAMDTLPEAKQTTVYTKKGNGLREAFAREKISHIQLQEIGFGKLWKDIGLFFASKKDMYVFNGPQVPLFFVPKNYGVVVYDFAYRYVQAESMKEKMKNTVTNIVSSFAFKRAKLILTLSETIKKEVSSIFHVSPEKIKPMYAGFLDVCKIYPAEPISFDFKSFFLFVSTIKERKNVLGVVKGFADLKKNQNTNAHLVIAGKYNEGSVYFESIKKFILENDLGGSVHFLGHISDRQLSWLYQNALALVSPSFVEGFGLPLLEAFVCRLPVITSKDSCQSEITGDAAVLVDPADPIDIGKGMAQVLEPSLLRAGLIEKGLIRAKKFTWERSAEDFFRFVKGFLDAPN